MRWLDKNNNLKWHSDKKYQIDWNKKAPSKGAQEVKDFLEKYCFKHVLFQEYRLPGCLLRVDFLDATKKMAIEFNGKQHSEYVKHFHGNKLGFWKQLSRDTEKREILERNDFILIEIEDSDLPLTREFFKKFGVII